MLSKFPELSPPPSWDGRHERRTAMRFYLGEDGQIDSFRTYKTALLPDLRGFRRRALLAVGGASVLSLLSLQFG